jgi:hypothetical protein
MWLSRKDYARYIGILSDLSINTYTVSILQVYYLNKTFRACLGISGMNGNEGYWGGGISIISQNFPKSPSILFHPLDSSISQTRP